MDINQMARELERDEARRPNPYKDSKGKLTIGVGRNLDDVGLTDEEIDHLLHNDIERTAADLHREMPWTERLDDVRYRVLVNMAFNMGISRLHTFVHFLAACEAGRYHEAAAEMLNSKWHDVDVGVRAERLARMMETGHAD